MSVGRKGIYLLAQNREPPAVSYVPVKAAIFQRRYPLFWVMSKPFFLKIFWKTLRRHHQDNKFLFQ